MQFVVRKMAKKVTVGRAVDLGLVLGIAFSLAMKPSYAYLDPGTGSYLFQMAIAGLFGVLFAIRSFWQQIKLFVTVKVLRRSDSAS